MHRVPADWRHDLTALPPELPLAKGQVIFADLAMRKLPAQPAVSLIMLRHHKTPACVLVEPVHDPGPHLPANPAQRPTVEQKRVNQRSRLHPGSRVDGEPSRLIYNQQVVVLVKDPNRNIFRCQVDGLRRGFTEKDDVPRVHRIPGPAAFAVTSDVTTPNQALDP